VKLILHS